MMTIRCKHSHAILLMAGLLSACATGGGSETAATSTGIIEEAPVVEEGWRGIARPEDHDRLDRLESAWTAALAEAREAGFGDEIEAEGELLDPEASLARGAPPPGSYHCRVIKIGTQGGEGRAYTAYKPFFCHVAPEEDVLTIVKQTGSQRPAGRLYPESDERMIFLGTMALGNEDEPLAYGEDPERDMVGVMERVGPFRYRLVVPWPRIESKLDVFELVPATE